MQTDVEAFLQRIRAFPDDDTPRLIFADWLEEQAAAQNLSRTRPGSPGACEWGEARGRFIRIQIAIARLQEEESREGEFARRSERESAQSELMKLEKEEQELLDAHRDDWMAAFHGLATGPIFRRGFVEEVNATARDFLRHAHELFAAGPLRHVHLLDVGGNLPGVLQCPYLSRLSALTIHASYAGEPLARAAARSEFLIGLKMLHLTRNRFEDDGAEHLASSQILSSIEDLDLGENELGETSARALAASPHLGKLKRLELRHNRLGPTGAEAIAASERLPNLQRLGLSGNEIGTARLQALNRSEGFLRVPVLDLSSNELTAAGLQVILSRSLGPPDPAAIRLRDLDLSRNRLGDAGMRVLAARPQLEGLQILRLVDCGIGDEGVRALANSPYLNNVVVLDLSNNPIGDSGCRVLLDPPHFRKLKRPITPLLGVSQDMTKALYARYPERLR